MVDWSQAPQEILGSIAERLNSIEDYLRFGGVCRSWRFVTLDHRRFRFSPKTLPWLMFPLHKKDEDGKDIDNPNFFSLSDVKFYKRSLPEARGCCFSGSKYGWLILFGDGRIELYNPLTRNRIGLPLPYTNYRVQKGFLSMPSSITSPKDQFLVVVNFFKELAFIRPGDTTWTTIEIPVTNNSDIIQLNDVFYIIDSDGIIRTFDIRSPKPAATEFMLPPEDIQSDQLSFYLVGLRGELHMVVKYHLSEMFTEGHHFMPGSRPFAEHQTYYFRVFKLDLSTKKWKEVFTLGDYTIFVGRNTSIYLLATDFVDCSRSSIYFADSWMGDDLSTGDIGIFNLETEGMEALFTGKDVVGLYSTPVWFTPSLC
ncbi:SWR1-complex protein 3 [Ranunculus cassubicifolius]